MTKILKHLTICNLIYLTILCAIFIYLPKITDKIEDQNKFFERVSVYTPDLNGLPMTRLRHLESQDEKQKIYNILDEKTGRLKESGWMKRDENVIFNRDSVSRPDPKNNWLKENTKIRHQTLITVFSEKLLQIYRLFDFELNCILVTTHIVKPTGSGGDVFSSMAEDMQVKEPMGIVYSDTSSIEVQPFNVSSMHELLSLELDDLEKGHSRVLSLSEANTHPFNFRFGHRIYVDETDEPLTLLQEQSEDGTAFGVWSSRLGLNSEGQFDYYAFRQHRNERVETYTNILVHTGVPLYGQGSSVHIQAAG